MKIAVGGIIHDRSTVPAYLDAITRLRTSGIDVIWTWVCDDVVDFHLYGLRSLIDRANRPPKAYYGKDIVVFEGTTLPGPRYNRQTSRDREMYGRLATLRNILADVALGMDCDALLSVDSDIVVPPDLLERLVATGKPWVAGLVRNDVEGTNPRGHWNVFRLRSVERDAGLTDHFMPMGPGFPTEEVLGWDPRDPKKEQCLAAGAVCLYGRELLEAAQWCTDGRGRQEDIGFAMQAFKAGYRASYVPVRCRHLTVDGQETG